MSKIEVLLYFAALVFLALALARGVWLGCLALPRSERIRVALLLGLIAGAFLVCLRPSPEQAGDLSIVPDSVEYAVAAQNIWRRGEASIYINQRALPSRYGPGFSLFGVLPANLLFGFESPGAAVYTVAAFAALALVTLGLGAALVSGVGGAIACCCLLLCLSTFVFFSSQVMSDVPAVALLGLVVLYSAALRGKQISWCDGLLLGGLCACAASFRATNLVCLIPVALVAFGQPLVLAAALLPTLLFVCATLVYQQGVFGSIWRSGYNFWCAWPYDFNWAVFNWRYIGVDWQRSLIDSGALPFLFVALAVGSVAWRSGALKNLSAAQGAHFRYLLYSAVLVTAPLLLFYLLYFYKLERFLLPVAALAALAGGMGLGMLCRSASARFGLVLLLGLLLWRVASRPLAPTPRLTALQQVRAELPPGALLISGIDPVYLTHFAASEPPREYLAISARVEFANKLIAYNALSSLDCYPESPLLHDHACVARARTQRAVERVADQSLGYIRAELFRGREVYLETSTISPDLLSKWRAMFELRDSGAQLWRVARALSED